MWKRANIPVNQREREKKKKLDQKDKNKNTKYTMIRLIDTAVIPFNVRRTIMNIGMK